MVPDPIHLTNWLQQQRLTYRQLAAGTICDCDTDKEQGETEMENEVNGEQTSASIVIGRWLTEKLTERGMTATDLANATGFSFSIVSKWATGYAVPSRPSLHWICEVLGTDYYPEEFNYWMPKRGQFSELVKNKREAFRNAKPIPREQNVQKLYSLLDQLVNDTVELDLDRVCGWLNNQLLDDAQRSRVIRSMY